MAIGQYTDILWFPDGSLAANVEVRIFPLSSNVLATLYTDATGTVIAPNPFFTTGSGGISFFATEGEYWMLADSRSFRISVGTPRTVDLFETGVGTLATGTIAGSHITASLTNPRAITIPETVGYVVDHSTSEFNPVVTRVHMPAQDAVLTTTAELTRTVTWWLATSAGAVIKQATRPTPEQRRTHIVLGASAYSPTLDMITSLRPQTQILPQQGNQLDDLMDSLGPFSLTGNAITPNTNLTFQKSDGSMFTRGFRYNESPNNPHQNPLPAQNPTQFRYGTQSTTLFPSTTVTNVDVANYDVGGVITPVPGGANTTTIQRVWAIATSTTVMQIGIQYGQLTFSSLTSALDRIGQAGYVSNPTFLDLGAVIGYLVVIKSATNLADPAQAIVVSAGKFPTP